MIGKQGLHSFLGPLAHEGTVGAFAIGGASIRCIIPGGDHDRERMTNGGGHQGASAGNMGTPGVELRQARALRIGCGTGVFVPADLIGTRRGLREEGLQVGLIVAIGHRADKVTMWSERFELRDDVVPGCDILGGRDPHEVLLVAKFVIDGCGAKEGIDVVNDA
jgi:hypothetical protein